MLPSDDKVILKKKKKKRPIKAPPQLFSQPSKHYFTRYKCFKTCIEPIRVETIIHQNKEGGESVKLSQDSEIIKVINVRWNFERLNFLYLQQ